MNTDIGAISVGDDLESKFPKTTCPVGYVDLYGSVSSTILKKHLQLQEVVVLGFIAYHHLEG